MVYAREGFAYPINISVNTTTSTFIQPFLLTEGVTSAAWAANINLSKPKVHTLFSSCKLHGWFGMSIATNDSQDIYQIWTWYLPCYISGLHCRKSSLPCDKCSEMIHCKSHGNYEASKLCGNSSCKHNGLQIKEIPFSDGHADFKKLVENPWKITLKIGVWVLENLN